jgi:hypothetical protein
MGVGIRYPVRLADPSRTPVGSEDLRASPATGVGMRDLPPWPRRPEGPFMSIATGVGRRRTASVSEVPVWRPFELEATFPEPFTSIAVGVGRRSLRARVISEGVPELGLELFEPFCVEPTYGDAIGVGSKHGRRNAVPFDTPPALGQVSEYASERSRKVSCDVLQEHVAGSHLANDAPDLGPEPSLVELAQSAASARLRLARVPSDDEIHAIPPRPSIKRAEVVPDRVAPVSTRHQGLFFHPGHEDGRSVGLPLDSAHNAQVGEDAPASSLEGSEAGAECECSDVEIRCHGA